MRWLGVGLVVIVFGWGWTQTAPVIESTVTTQAEVAQLIASATNEILFATPKLLSHTLAEALREAMVVRGVDVYLLVSPDAADGRASYVMSLQLAGARVRLATLAESYLVVDRQGLVNGPLLAALEMTPQIEKTTQTQNLNDVDRAVSWFYEAFRDAPVYESTIPQTTGGQP